jgi:ribosome recycling factor
MEQIQVNISQIAVEEFALDFYKMEKSSIDHIREEIYDMIEMATDDPSLTEDPRFMEELTIAFTMREALKQIHRLHDA